MFSNGKIKVKAIENSCILLGMCFLFATLLLMLGYIFFKYKSNEILLNYLSAYVFSAIILLYMEFVYVKPMKFYSFFGIIIFFVYLFIFFIYKIFDNLNNLFEIIFFTPIFSSATIIIINNLITRVFFWKGDDKNSQDVDAVSSEFAVDVLSIALFLGIILGLFAYLFFVPNKDISLFFGSIDVKTVALATAGLVTFFWAAKAAKNKSIELEEKKQDGKRRDKEIKMAEARDTAQLIAKASELLGSESDAQKNAGLAFLNTVASQKGGPLQKEAFDLLADFILSARDTTTSNKPRTRAISYVNNLLKDQCHDFELNEYVKISGTIGLDGKLEKGKNIYKFDELHILYNKFYFSPAYPFFQCDSSRAEFIVYNNCQFYNFSGQSHFGTIDNIYVNNSEFVKCKIGFIFDCRPLRIVLSNGSQNPDMDERKYKFEKCDFSKCMGWRYLYASSKPLPEAKRVFNDCFYYPRHAPFEFNEDDNRALLTEITSREQFNKLVGKSIYMMYSPPDDDKKTPNE